MADKDLHRDGLRQRKKDATDLAASKAECKLGELSRDNAPINTANTDKENGDAGSTESVDAKLTQVTSASSVSARSDKSNGAQPKALRSSSLKDVETKMCIRCLSCCFCCCVKQRRSRGPWLVCGIRLSRQLRKPSFVIGLLSLLSLTTLVLGMLLGAISSLIIIHRMRIDTHEYTSDIAGMLGYIGENFHEASRLFTGASSICYSGKGGQRPFSEHDGNYEDVSRISVTYEVEEWYPKPVSQFQDLEVFRSKFFGKVLVIDDEIMITERDEAHYHEMLAHVPLAYTPGSKNRQHRDGLHVLIIGGGDGGTLTQVLKHNDVVQATIIELDPAVVAASREHFPHLAAAYDDPRVTLLHENGAKWVAEYAGLDYSDDSELEAAFDSILGAGDERTRATRMPVINKRKDFSRGGSRIDEISGSHGESTGLIGPAFDVVLVDSTDFGVAKPLFTRSFYESVHHILVPETGILCFNVESPSWAEKTVTAVTEFLSSIFRHAYPYQLHMPTYSSGHYSFLMASDGVHPYRQPIDWQRLRGKGFLEDLEYYSPEIHVGAFALPNRFQRSRRIKLDDLKVSLNGSDFLR